MSPIRAAGMPPIRTVKAPIAITSGGPTQTAMSPTRAAGRPPIRTVTASGGRIGPRKQAHRQSLVNLCQRAWVITPPPPGLK